MREDPPMGADADHAGEHLRGNAVGGGPIDHRFQPRAVSRMIWRVGAKGVDQDVYVAQDQSIATFQPIEKTGAVVQVHTRQNAASGAAFGERHGITPRAPQGTTQRKLKPLLDERGERHAAPRGLPPGTFHERFVEAYRGSHMSKHTASMSVCPIDSGSGDLLLSRGFESAPGR